MPNKPKKESVDVDKLLQTEQQRQAEKTVISDEFVTEHMSMIEAIASKAVRSGKKPACIDFEDLISWGVEGLIKAHQNFKDDKGSTFKTYAYYRIRGEIFDRIRQEWQYRNPSDYQAYRKQIQDRIAEVIEGAIDTEEREERQAPPNLASDLISSSAMVCLMSIDSVSDIVGASDPSMELVDNGILSLRQEIENLDMEERQLIELFYLEDMSQKEIAEKLKRSRSKICRMHMKVIEKLRRRLMRHEDYA